MMRPDNLILSVDIGTTEIKAVLVSSAKGYLDSRQVPCPLIYPERNCVEQSPEEMADGICSTIRELLSAHPDAVEQIAGLTFTSQMGNTLPVDCNGRPLMNFFSWMDERAVKFTNDELYRGLIRIEGQPLLMILNFLRISGGAPGKNGKDILCKMAWLKRFQPQIYEKSYKFFDVKDYAVFLATGRFVTSYDIAYITWLMDTRQKDQSKWAWSPALSEMVGLKLQHMPDLKASTEVAGNVTSDFSKKTGLPEGLPVINGSGDLLTSAIGSGAIAMGDLHINIGTAGWAATHCAVAAVDIKHYVGTIASGMPGKFLLLSKQETLGGALDWVKGMLYPKEFIKDTPNAKIYALIDESAGQSPPGANGVLFTPWLLGERSPVNDANLRGQFFNLGMSINRNDLLRSVFEGVAFNIRWGMEYVEAISRKKTGRVSDEIRFIGGASKSKLWCQVFADVLQRPVVQMGNPQMACAMGVAAIAFVGLGIWKDFGDIDRVLKKVQVFQPNRNNKEIYDKLYHQFRALYRRNRKIYVRLNA
ncbi:MAG: FGGY-family carbohydrate kinase [Desulfobacterales bacterium]|nr:FGGY-family carbohydrate kinase [Desulfobacterales bacterium]